jgi:DNA-binding NarL/FixJ family response regulator
MGLRGKLTQREQQVLMLIAEGYSHNQVADKLCISPKTAEQHVRNILSRYRVTRAIQAVVLAIREGHIDLAKIRVSPDRTDDETRLE